MGRNKTKVVVSNFYDPFGNSVSKTEAVNNPWQFASGYLDANTGLYKFGERYYDPTLGRWTQKDPVGGSLGSVNSTNPYVHADNLPNMLVDPTGRIPSPENIARFLAAVFGIIAALCGVVGAAALISGTLLSGPAAPQSLLIGLALCAAFGALPAAFYAVEDAAHTYLGL